jgi:hypothetical protein
MFERINIYYILRDHFGTLKSLGQKSARIHWKDFMLFILFPMVLAVYFSINEYSLEKQLNGLIAAISIFGGFLFNLLAIIYSQIDKLKSDAEKSDNALKRRFVKEIHVNISFCIVLSIFTILALLLSTVEIPFFKYDDLLIKFILGLNYFLLILFFLSVIMVLNRVYILLKKDVE